jgi:Pathogenicity locus
MARNEPDELREIPGVGVKTDADMKEIGIKRVDDLKGRDPQELYDTLCFEKGVTIDRCMLYVFRCAVYYASNDEHDPELLKWWNWKDSE